MYQILHCVFGITVLRGEPGSTTLQPRMHLGFMDPLPIHLPLVMKVTSQICVSMGGMNGVTSGIKLQVFPNNKDVLGRVLGPARGAGNEMAQWILKANGRVVPRRSLRPLKVDEIHSPAEIKKREVFDELIKRRWGTPMTPPNTQQQKAFEKYEDHEQQEQPLIEVEDIVDSTDKLINQQPATSI